MTSLVSSELDSTFAKSFAHGINRIAVNEVQKFTAYSDVDMNVTVVQGPEIVFSHNFTSLNEKIRPTDRVRGLVFSPDGDHLYVAAGDCVRAIDTSTWNLNWSVEAPRSFGFLIISPMSIDVTPAGDVVIAFDNGSFGLWNRQGQRQTLIKDNDTPRWLRSANGGRQVVGSDSYSIVTWLLSEKFRKKRVQLTSKAFAFDAHSSGEVVAIRDLTGIVIWSLSTLQPIRTLKVSPSLPLVAFHPQRHLLAYGEKSRVVLVDTEGNLVNEFDLPVASAVSIAFTTESEELVIGCTDNLLVRQSLSA